MTTLTTIRTIVRQDLHDEDAGAYRWTDAVLNRHITRAVNEYSLAKPLEQTSTIATTLNSRDISLSTLTGLVKIIAVEFPLSQFPPAYQRFSTWSTNLSLLGGRTGTGANAKIYWGKLHTLDASSSTIDPADEDLICTGAAAFAALDESVYTMDSLNTGGPQTPADFQRLGQQWLLDFRNRLRNLNRKVKTAQIYGPATMPASKTTDWGPQ